MWLKLYILHHICMQHSPTAKSFIIVCNKRQISIYLDEWRWGELSISKVTQHNAKTMSVNKTLPLMLTLLLINYFIMVAIIADKLTHTTIWTVFLISYMKLPVSFNLQEILRVKHKLPATVSDWSSGTQLATRPPVFLDKQLTSETGRKTTIWTIRLQYVTILLTIWTNKNQQLNDLIINKLSGP